MPSHSTLFRFATLILVLTLLGAQLHFCADFAAGNAGSHVCQLCATTGLAVAGQLFAIELAPTIHRLEAVYASNEIVSLDFATTSPRAPPAL
jgi:hypothetical protein